MTLIQTVIGIIVFVIVAGACDFVVADYLDKNTTRMTNSAQGQLL